MSTPVDVIFGMSYGGNLLHYRKADSCGKNHFLPTANLHGTCFGKHISGCNLQSPLPHLTAPGASQSQNQAAGRGCAELPGWQKQSLSACPSTAPQCLTSCPNLGAFTGLLHSSSTMRIVGINTRESGMMLTTQGCGCRSHARPSPHRPTGSVQVSNYSLMGSD